MTTPSLTLKLNLEVDIQVSTKKLRLHLREYLEQASRGRSIIISMRGKAVARLSRIESSPLPESDDLFGIWADQPEIDVDQHLREMRRGRTF